MEENIHTGTQYQHQREPLEKVSKDIDEFIIPECQEACKNLWSNNIITWMCSNLEDEENKYILLGTLSEANANIIKKLIEQQPDNYRWDNFRGCYSINYTGSREEASKRLVELSSVFEMQDVLEEDEAFDTIETFLRDRCGLYKTITEIEERKEPKIEEFENLYDYVMAMTDFEYYGARREVDYKIFDESKMTKSIEDYLQDAGVLNLYDSERGIVYTSEFYRDMHLRYLQHLKESVAFETPEPEDLLDASEQEVEFSVQATNDKSREEGCNTIDEQDEENK